MSHGITRYDITAGTEAHWHGLNKIMPQSEINQFDLTPLNREVYKTGLYFGDDFAPTVQYKLEKGQTVESLLPCLAMRGVDGNQDIFLTVADESYPVIQNSEYWETIQAMIEEFGFNVYACGSLHGLRKWFMSLRSDKSTFVLSNGHEIANKIALQWSHDKSWKFTAFNTTVDQVCMNTCRAAIESSKEAKKQGQDLMFLTSKRTKNGADKLRVIADAITGYYSQLAMLQDTLNQWIATPCTIDQADRILMGVFASKSKSSEERSEEISTRSLNQVEQMIELFSNGTGTSGENKFDLFSCVTEYYTHKASENAEKLALSSEFGTYSNKKEQFFRLLCNEDAIDETEEKGKELICLR